MASLLHSPSAKKNLSHILSITPLHVITHQPLHKAFFNLCTTLKPPSNIQCLLLCLGLNFCLKPSHTTTHQSFQVSENWFIKDIYTKIFFSHFYRNLYKKQLQFKSNWSPNSSTIPIELCVRIQQYTKHSQQYFYHQKHCSNLTPYQQYLLQHLINNQRFIAVPADKNLGTCLLKREIYIRRAITDHLSDCTTYQQLYLCQSTYLLHCLENSIHEFLCNNC